jgi:hypothetical protein
MLTVRCGVLLLAAYLLQGECSGRGTCLVSSGSCACFAGYGGSSCSSCVGAYAPSSSGTCVFLAGSLSSCTDAVRNGDETGVDCGGPHCGACSVGSGTSRAIRAARIYAPILAGIVLVAAVTAWVYVAKSKRQSGGRTFFSSPSKVYVVDDGAVDGQVFHSPAHDAPRRPAALTSM